MASGDLSRISAAHCDRLLLQFGEGHDLVDHAHLVGLVGRVLAAEVPDLPGALVADHPGQQSGAVAAVERAHLGAGLPEHGVVGGDGQVGDEVEDVAAADGVSGDHGDDRLGEAPHLDLEVEHVEAGCPAGSRYPASPRIFWSPPRAERLVACAGEDDHPDGLIVPGDLEGIGQLEQGGWPEGVADFRSVDGDLGDAVDRLVDDVFVLA